MPIQVEHIASLQKYFTEKQNGPFNNQIQLKIISVQENDDFQLKGLGTYGFIKNPAGFIIASIKDAPGSLEDFGYILEELILQATNLGLGTCWLGGTFTKSRFARIINLQEDEDIPCVISLGYPSNQQAWVDRVARTYAGADRRLSWKELFFIDTFNQPISKEQAGSYQEPLELVRLAPSASNKQPWRILKLTDNWHFYIQRTKKYPTPVFKFLLGLADLQRVDLGIAMAHFENSARDLKLSGEWTINNPALTLPDPKIEYVVSWTSTM